MSEARGVENADETEPDALTLSALLCSRVCHDLINPVGAVQSGLDALESPDIDPGMRDAALDLVRSGSKKAIALLSYARLAYGAAGGYGAEISLNDAKKALEGVFEFIKPQLEWRLGDGVAPKDYVKTALILGFAAADCAPRGGAVAISGDDKKIRIVASGAKIYPQEGLQRALSGDFRDLAPKFAPAAVVYRIAAAQGAAVAVEMNEKHAVIDVLFQPETPPDKVNTLTHG